MVELGARRATTEELTLVHPAGYLAAVEAFCRQGGGAIDPDTTVSPGSWDTALLYSCAHCDDITWKGNAQP